MDKNGPILIIDDDPEDLDIFLIAFKETGVQNDIILFEDSPSFLEYLRQPQPNVFFILCDINMPHINGFELRRQIAEDAEVKLRSIPFLFFSNVADQRRIDQAYQQPIQGYFVKPPTFEETRRLFKFMIEYWSRCELSFDHSVNES